MLRLRPYKPCDAEKIAGWIKTEEALFKWSADRFEKFPVTAADINRKYISNNGDCPEPDNFFPVTAFDESGVIGSLILRYTDSDKKTLRFGFVVVDDSRRGRGYGKEMLRLALRFAFDVFGAERVTLGVFDTNPIAHACYKAVGFNDVGSECNPMCFNGEPWNIVEMEILRTDWQA